jgi:hypothetical protein
MSKEATPEQIEALQQGGVKIKGRPCFKSALNDRNPHFAMCGACRGAWDERGCREAVRVADLVVGAQS